MHFRSLRARGYRTQCHRRLHNAEVADIRGVDFEGLASESHLLPQEQPHLAYHKLNNKSQ